MAELISSPLFVVGAPRSGTSTVVAVLGTHPRLWWLHGEAYPVFEGPFRPSLDRGSSHVLTARDAEPSMLQALEKRYFSLAGNIDLVPVARRIPIKGRGRRRSRAVIRVLSAPVKRAPIRLIDKTIPHALRIPFLKAWFPDARFLHLTADPRKNLGSMYRGWRNPNPRLDYTIPDWFHIEGFDGEYWRFVIPPNWESLSGATLMQVCSFQWRSLHEHCLEALGRLPADDWMRVKFEDFLASPRATLSRIAEWARLDPEPFERFRSGIPRINVSRRPDLTPKPSDADLDDGVRSVASCALTLGYRDLGSLPEANRI